MKGFLITCNNREKEAVKEAYNLLNEYADKLYGPEQVMSKDTCRSCQIYIFTRFTVEYVH